MRHARQQLHFPLTVCILLLSSAGAQRVNKVTPKLGSINGATRLTIEGQGFAQASQFNLNTNDPNFGNSVTLVSQIRSFPCDVERDSSHSTKIMCYTRAMPEDDYQVQVSVDGVPVPSSQACNGYPRSYWCMFYIRSYNTPSIQSIRPLSGPPGTVVTLRGRIYTDVYGSNTDKSSNGLDVRFLRSYMGGMPCELLKPNSDEKYGLYLDSDTSQWGYMSCKISGTYIGHHNLSYILDSEYGRSLPDFAVFSISALNKLAMFQTYAEVTGVFPSEGSMLGGTLLTIQGQNFDETDQPALVLVGGNECQIQKVSNNQIVCVTPAYERTNMTVFPGGRGFKMEMWNNSNPNLLEDVLKYNSSRPGYSVQWVDSLSYLWPDEIDYFVARFSGFFVPTETDNYYFRIKADDRGQLYFSKTGLPQDKVKIAYQPYYTNSFFTYSTQRSAVMRLEKGKPYYIEVLMQEYAVVASVDVGFFKEVSPFTAQQTIESVNEKQQINAYYSILPEKQVIRFDGWTPVTAVNEVQTLRISSDCFSQGTCENTYYSLGYGNLTTGPIPVSASAMDLQNALNDLWTIKPDNITVTKQELDTESVYNVTFNSKRGDFEDFDYMIMDLDTNITVTEAVKGKASMETFTLLWAEVPSLPLPFNASETEVRSALDLMITAKCPAEIPTAENSNVKFFRDYEMTTTGFSGDLTRRGVLVNDSEAFCGRWCLKNPEILFNANDTTVSGAIYNPILLQPYMFNSICLAYKGSLVNKLGILFSYVTANTYREESTFISVQFDSTDEWNYKCVDLLASIQKAYIGSNFKLLQLSVYGVDGNSVFFIDAVQIGRATTLDSNVILHRRRPPALASSGLFLSNITVSKRTNSSQISYEITATPYNCGNGVPLIEIGFLQKMASSTGDLLIQSQGDATATIIRPQKASPPLTGTFDVEFNGRSVEGLAVDISAADLQYALQGIPELGQLQVQKSGNCKGYTWNIQWLTIPGNQPLLKINASNVIGVNPSVTSREVEQGGLFKQKIMGDFLRVPTNKPQVQVLINGIPSWCSGDCGFTWSESKTPTVTGISPTEGSSSLGTVLTITGSGFNGGNVTVKTGDVECSILQVTNTSITCQVGPASAGVQPVSLSFSLLGNARYPNNSSFNFTHLFGVTSINPTSGSVAGGTVLTVSGYGFSNDAAVTIGTQPCSIVEVELFQLRCIVPAGSEGEQTVTMTAAKMTAIFNGSFTYSNTMTALITSVSPQTTTVFGNRSLTILGKHFGATPNDISVLIGDAECELLQWTNESISCLLPTLPPAVYNVNVRVGNQGYPLTSPGVNTTIEYALEVTGFSPSVGSLFGGTTITIMGSGFSPDIQENNVTLGDTQCTVTAASDVQLECVTQSRDKTYTVTNQGVHPVYGQGYAWSPSALITSVGDTVVWRWSAPAFVPGLAYRVFSVSSPSSTNYDGTTFSSGDTQTANGFFAYRFTSPGVYYYSSGYIDSAKQKTLQGVVTVMPLEESTVELQVFVKGVQASVNLGQINSSDTDCMATSNCPQDQLIFNDTSDGLYFSFTSCATPTVYDITPGYGTTHDIINIRGSAFSNITCANEVKVGDLPCSVINSSSTEINCQLSPDSRAPVGVPLPLTVQVNNLGNALLTMPKEIDRRFVVLPVVDSIFPVVGSTTGSTRLLISGSGFFSGSVMVANVPCKVVSFDYSQMVCDTSPSIARSGDVTVYINSISSSCSSDCKFEYSDSITPQVSTVSPSSVSGNSTTVTVTGSGFGNNPADLMIFADNILLKGTQVNDSSIEVLAGALPAGTHTLKVVVMSKGLATGSATLTSIAQASINPTSGSIAGGTPLLITGNGFVAGNTTVKLGNSLCKILDVTADTVRCLTPPRAEGQVQVNIKVFDVVYPPQNFNYSKQQTPNITSVTPKTGPVGTQITVSGSGFGTDSAVVSLKIDSVACNISSITDTQLLCTVGEHAGGTFPVLFNHQVKGYALTQSVFKYELLLTGVTPNEGSYAGGAVVAIQGSGFDPNITKVLICNRECTVHLQDSTSTQLNCEVPPNNGSEAFQVCAVIVMNGGDSVNLTSGYTYRSSLTPVISNVTPRRGGTAGGTRLTITGSGFSSNISEIAVTIAGSICDIQSANETQIICVTNAGPKSQETQVRVQLGNRGIARMDNASFFYIDVWSSPYTWGGLSPPEEGSFAVITAGQTILLDTSTPILKMLLIQGGRLIFDEADIELQAENILITDGGALQIGTEQMPFQHKAIITLHGHLRSQELPVYGTKTLGVRQGVLDLHGIPVPMTWTRLSQTAQGGSSTLTLMDAVTWKIGDEIVIASTGHRHSQAENELKRIASVSADGRTLTLTEPLTNTHLGVSVTLPDGTVFEARAEVGLLTRNIVVRGSNNAEWNDQIKACPSGFNTGEFATQTCFQGRFGEEVGSDQFGGCIMFHAPQPNQNLAIGRIEYVELFNVGQAFRLGRYPIHWHLMGDVQFKSYVRGCGIHQSYNRAVTIHNTHNLLVERNVIYNIMGGAFFIEDGIETGNILQYNLAVFVKQSTSLLNDDVTPAGFWVTNPNNIIRHNAAAGGTHFGFWYRMHDNPDGPSYDPNICQKKVPLGQFFNNTVHSQGWFGLWIFQEFFPMRTGSCSASTPAPAIFRRFTSWNNEKGAEWVNVGSVQFSEFLMVNNEKAGVETKRIIRQYVSGWGLDGGAAVVNSTMVGHVDELGLGSNYCTYRGVVLPLDDGMSIINTKFVNFNRPSCAAVGVAEIIGTCTFRCGGWSARFSGIQYYQSPNKAWFRWEHEVALVDVDGSLTGNVSYKVVPTNGLLDPRHCSPGTEWSIGVPGSVCDNTINFHRLVIVNPSPPSLLSKDVVLTNSYGTCVLPFLKKLVTHTMGWLVMLPTGETYNWYFNGASQITNISYNGMVYGFRPENYVIMNHNLTQAPDRFRIIDDRNGSSQALNPTANVNGDWYFNQTSKNVYYMVSGRDRLSSRRRRNSVDRSLVDRSLDFRVYQCYYPNCIQPAPPPAATSAPTNGRRPANSIFWSNTSFWRSSIENNFTVPQQGSDVVIPSGIWVVVDVVVPSLNKLKIVGVLEIPDTNNDTSMQYNNVVLNATYISIQGGRLIAGWPDAPFRGQLQIILKGSHTTPDWLLPSGPNQGSKVLGVFGSLDLYGMPHNIYHTKLASTSQAGNNTLSLQESVDWKVGDKILLSTTSYDPWQTEIRNIIAVSNYGRTLTLDQPLTYTHIGESYSVPGTSRSYQLAGNVALLTRNIQIIGQEYPEMFTQSYGARVLVGTFFVDGITFRGKAQIRNVQFYHTGQEGWNDLSDPRYSLVFFNLESVAGESYVKGCSFHDGFAPAIGIFGTDGLSIDDNVIHHTVGEGIRVWGDSNVVRRNLVTLTLWPGSYNGRAEEFNFQWNAGIEVSEATNVILQGNIVAGYERVGFRIDGEPCPGVSNPVAQWSQNEAHGGLFGLYMNKDGLPGCSQIQGFTVWRSFDFGIYVQVSMSVLISNVSLIDNGMGIMSLIYEPPAVSHRYSDKTVRVQGALIVGSSPNFNCLDSLSTTMTYVSMSRGHGAPRPPNGGRSGVCWPTFESDHNHAPQKPHPGLMSYNAITGLMTVSDTTFVGFKSVCSTETNYMFMTNPGNEDLQHPISVERITKINSTEDCLAFIHRPDVSKANPSDCVDMDCDAKKKSLLKDLDGSFLGAVGAVVPDSEYEWDGDPQHGLGDYRIPKVMLTYLNGSRIPVNQISPYKGVIKKNCTYMSTWQSYKCFGLNYKMLVIESLDADTETRRLSPVAILGDKYVDLINGPQDHGWCAGYTCQKRVSLFHAIVATSKSFDIYFTSTTPQNLRLMLLNAGPTEAVRVAVFYSNPQRLDVYVNNSLVGPTNAQWNAGNTDYTLLGPTYTGQYVPSFNASHGSNFFDQDYKMMNILLRGSDPVQIRTSPVLFVAFNLPAMTEAEFFGANLINNLAAFLKIPSYKIRITNIIREGTNARRRRSTGLTVEVEIREPPTQTTTNSTTDNTQQFDVLKNIADDLGRAAVSGNLSQSIGFNVSSMGIIPPPPSSSDPAWNNVATQEVTRADQQVETVKTVSSLLVVVQPEAGSSLGLLNVQPSIMALDTAGDCVSVGVTSLTLSAELKDANGNPVEGLYGNTTIPFSGCWANFTDLAIYTSGDNLKLAFTLTEWKAESRSFTLSSPTTPSSVVVTTGDDFPSIFDSSPAISTLSVYLLMLFSALLLLLQHYE
ncbi:PKHD1 like 1, tandem duplicate 1 isoform X1 [Danio rerio]|uniref:PKHD1 like 1, tandem duplicate 1 precursor n=2 Tax=Danio rerio TaxID=7955 RepID=A0A8M1P7C8_DANRE|nr:PKHD1 like 1, tandem duplicate 1 precursor [Danio rerio]XP_009292516.1 fibrocystin-L isoform X1 [Danio rerio]|eukprot:NP_001305057.1 fibrocystin-L precursor [Danio rerio]